MRPPAPLLALAAVTILAGCSGNVPPSDPLLIIRSSGWAFPVRDTTASADQPRTIAPGGDAGSLIAAANTGLAAALPAAGLTSLASGLLAGLSLLTVAPETPSGGGAILIWAPKTTTVSRASLQATYANAFVAAWANALGARVPGARFTPHPIPPGDVGTKDFTVAWIDMDDPYCHQSGITCHPVVTASGPAHWPRNTAQLPERLVGFSGRQTFIMLELGIGTYNTNHWLSEYLPSRKSLTSRWPMLEALTDASRSLPPYAWVFIMPNSATWQTPTGLKFLGEPVMLNQGHILRFIRPTGGAPQPPGTS